jgi:hypothetical protein
MDLREIVCEDGRWIELAQDRVQWWTLPSAVFILSGISFTFSHKCH